MQKNNYKNNQIKSQVLKRESLILAYTPISLSEVYHVFPAEYYFGFEVDNPIRFKEMLFTLGLDVSLPYDKQTGLLHRNRLNKVVKCDRYVGEERQDKDWITSGFASREAIDKYSRNKILEDLYRMRNCTKDTEAVLASKDHYTVIDETQWMDYNPKKKALQNA